MADNTARGGAPSGMRLSLGLAAIVVAAVSVFWLLRGEAPAVGGDKEAAEFATLCPRWTRLAEDLLSFEGGVGERCKLVSRDPSGKSYLFQAAPNIEVDVLTKADGPGGIENVRIRDIRSRASVTYNAEALALLK
jgi:hypothetical protein